MATQETIKTNYIINTTVVWFGWIKDSGWFVRFEGSQERMHLSNNEEPKIKVGDKAKITIEIIS